jgi:hypothetical protein
MEEIKITEISHNLIRLRQYEEDLKGLTKLEPRLHEEVRESIRLEVESGKLDEIKGSGGWVKGRAKSPSRNIGISGGFRFMGLLPGEWVKNGEKPLKTLWHKSFSL